MGVTQAEWDTLQRGDRVMVHDSARDDVSALHLGVVAIVTPTRRHHDLGIRLLDDDRIVYPSRMRVHHSPLVDDETCVWCG